ncbi:hypothetical protein [Variovorax sp. JS1663]|uniref:hypothetical protein n=1 Tax=Variovorax sp. JS1663 TaxID=1851577 RepID=UPI000B345F2A|nr:hypothetical protein [Variovorax sp. JS1663]OUM01605.1 hypothetical protein A8M77_15125 [Variovorax sp. JS1663]
MLDPLGMWRDALSQWENRTNQVANKEMKSEDFARAANALLGMSLGLQQALGKANSTLLKELNLPSRAELLALDERLQRIEEQLALLARQWGAAGPAEAKPTMPPRTRRPAPAAAATGGAVGAPPQPPAHAGETAAATPRSTPRKPAAKAKPAAGKPAARKARRT